MPDNYLIGAHDLKLNNNHGIRTPQQENEQNYKILTSFMNIRVQNTGPDSWLSVALAVKRS